MVRDGREYTCLRLKSPRCRSRRSHQSEHRPKLISLLFAHAVLAAKSGHLSVGIRLRGSARHRAHASIPTSRTRLIEALGLLCPLPPP